MQINLRPKDWKTPKYWAHLVIIVAVLELILFLVASWIIQHFGIQGMSVTDYFEMFFSWFSVILLGSLGVADITAHTIMGID